MCLLSQISLFAEFPFHASFLQHLCDPEMCRHHCHKNLHPANSFSSLLDLHVLTVAGDLSCQALGMLREHTPQQHPSFCLPEQLPHTPVHQKLYQLEAQYDNDGDLLLHWLLHIQGGHSLPVQRNLEDFSLDRQCMMLHSEAQALKKG